MDFSDTGYFQFYTANLKPQPEVIKALNDLCFSKNQFKLKLLEEALQYNQIKDWCEWIKTIQVRSIPFRRLYKCLIIATVNDFLPVFEWVHTNWSFDQKAASAYYRLACFTSATDIKIFLEKIYPHYNLGNEHFEKCDFNKLVSSITQKLFIRPSGSFFQADSHVYIPEDFKPSGTMHYIRAYGGLWLSSLKGLKSL